MYKPIEIFYFHLILFEFFFLIEKTSFFFILKKILISEILTTWPIDR